MTEARRDRIEPQGELGRTRGDRQSPGPQQEEPPLADLDPQGPMVEPSRLRKQVKTLALRTYQTGTSHPPGDPRCAPWPCPGGPAAQAHLHRPLLRVDDLAFLEQERRGQGNPEPPCILQHPVQVRQEVLGGRGGDARA